jgi:hypothetical protein
MPKKRISREKGGQNHVTSWADIVSRGADQEIQETHVEAKIDTQTTGDKMTKDTQLADNRDYTLAVPPPPHTHTNDRNRETTPRNRQIEETKTGPQLDGKHPLVGQTT